MKPVWEKNPLAEPTAFAAECGRTPPEPPGSNAAVELRAQTTGDSAALPDGGDGTGWSRKGVLWTCCGL